LKKFDTAFMPL